MFWRSLIVICVAALASGTIHANDGEWRWRFFADDDGHVTLFAAEYDATDNVAIRFSCKRGSGGAHVTGDMEEKLRHAMADAIRADQYPRVEFMPGSTNDTTLIEPLFTESDGWLFSFHVSVDTAAFEQFIRTGMFQLRMNGVLSEVELKPGLENIAKFQAACRKPNR